ncbi:Stp1/IreP family PP2C-type Ser/Thr phosphatase [Ideonella azotifigens]|uniref:Stp1/IreP family PP2C-type Ser/Thr phosphatase n=1 Tax=Ideonella azotifigens TaxID=513160 RepID=A0ABN1JML2_9BURK|nr:Stp1/IreP family PP2C-type Ser/Thr phosphatase [Ideonella azotifigens]
MPLSLDYSSALDTGRARHNNEDAVLVDPGLSLCLLADGMGGYNAGEVASEMAVRVMRDHLVEWAAQQPDQSTPPTSPAVQAALAAAAQHANRAVFTAAQTVPEYNGMGTTLVGALFGGHQVWIGHLGDSRAYRWRAGRLDQLSRDHSLLQEQIDAGLLTAEEAQFAAHRNLVTRAVGVEPEVMLEVHEHALLPGDVILLCSDGLSDMLPDSGIAQVLRQHDSDLDSTAHALVDAANAAGGRDNISVILARTKGSQNASARAWWPFRR